MSFHFLASETEKLRDPENFENPEDSVVVAVDLGSEFTKVSYWNFEDGCSNIIRINGCESIPSAIAYDSYNEFVVGNEAIQRLQITPKQVVLHFPSFYGFEKEELAVKCVRDNSVCEVIRDDDATIQWLIITKKECMKLTLEEVTRDFLSYIKTEVSNLLQKSVSCIFIVSPHPSSVQSFFSKVSSMIATPTELISSSTCMCLSYGFYDDNVSKILLLIDFGWRAVTLQVVENVNNEYRIGPCLVCDDLSGRLLSSILYDYEVSKIPQHLRTTLDTDYLTKNKILLNIYSCLNHSKNLLELSKSEITLTQDKHVSFYISSKSLRKLLESSIEKFDKSVNDFFTKYSLTVNSFDDVLLSGGMANCLPVYEYIQQKFPNTYFPDLFTIYNPHNNANESVKVSGAAIQCARWMGLSKSDIQSLLLIDLLPHDLFVKSGDNYEKIIEKGSSIPCRKLIEFEIEEDQKNLTVEVYRKKEEDDDYVRLGEFDFKLNAIDFNETSSVGVAFTISENGGISATCTGSYEPEVNTTNVLILVIALIILIAIYIFLKVYFRDTRTLLGGNQFIFCCIC